MCWREEMAQPTPELHHFPHHRPISSPLLLCKGRSSASKPQMPTYSNLFQYLVMWTEAGKQEGGRECMLSGSCYMKLPFCGPGNTLNISIPNKSLLSDRGLKLISAWKPKNGRKGFDVIALSVTVMVSMASYFIQCTSSFCTYIFSLIHQKVTQLLILGYFYCDLGWVREAESEARTEAELLLSFECLRWYSL